MRDNSHGFIALPFLILVGIFILVAALLAVMYFQHSDPQKVVPVESGTCTCTDISDLENRLGEATAAIAEYQQATQEIKAVDAKNGKATMYSDDLYIYEQSNVQLAINDVHKAGTRSGSGTTDTACETKVEAGTPCLKGSFQLHENKHSETCQRIKQQMGDKYSSLTTDYRESLTMAEFWNDEISAYSAEITHLNKEIASARSKPGCLLYECKKGSGKFYNDKLECTNNCVRKIATLDNWCWEFNPGAGTYTGTKY